MPTNTVNLDALIPRADFSGGVGNTGGQPRSTISIPDLDAGFFSSSLRKPDFQRETTHWTPQKVVELVEAFLAGDLIPAVILWQRGSEMFVIDGAHRLSALIAWIEDDYGDKGTSLAYFGGRISDEQAKVAERTRKLINKQIGPFIQFEAARKNPDNISAEMRDRIARLGGSAVVVQWVTASDTKAAEDSFFKINQAAQPIDPTERRILEARYSPNAIAARCIVHGGTGHKYWSAFPADTGEKIEAAGAELYHTLYSPPLGDSPIKTLDVPVAGRGYNTLPFVFDLVNLANDVPIPDKAATRRVEAAPEKDADGSETLRYLERVKKAIRRITGTHASSLGLHPAIYFYGRTGNFQPISFLAAVKFVDQLVATNKLEEFTGIRAELEQFLFEHKEFISLTSNRLGSGLRSLDRIVRLYQTVMDELLAGKDSDTIKNVLFGNPDFSHLAVVKGPPPRATLKTQGKRKLQTGTKSAAFFRDAIEGAPRCKICGAAVHRNSLTFDHVTPRRDGGTADMRNTQLAHPYCNSTIKG